jgi:2-polyprenyl-6-methoxyphenol hydroxylase-like FAD-dependent oxidoreductase
VTEVPVLIVGGGPVGLTASILLAQQGVRSLLVERHPSTATLPKARAINARTMEMYRQAGVEAEIRAAGLPPGHARFVVWARSLAGEELERREPWRVRSESQAVSSVRSCLCAQDDLERVLRRFAEDAGGSEVRFGTEMRRFTQDATGVTATLVEHATSRETDVRARYVIAADGAQSGMRRALGVQMVGKPDIYDSVNVLLQADLRPWTEHRPSALYFIEQPSLKATFLTINGIDRWGFLVNSLAAYGMRAADFTIERTTELVHMAIGRPDVPVKILGIAPWTASAHVAESYQWGRVFLAGDAAHEMPPTGGFGLNTGVQDVQNLAWKLAAVLQGGAAPALLETYDAERRPVGRMITDHSLGISISMGRLGDRGPGFARPEYLNDQGMVFGASYDSAAIVPDGTSPPSGANPVTDYVASARPGARAPHAWLERTGARVSTLDLVGKRFALLASGAGWSTAAEAVRVPVDVTTVGDTWDLRDPGGQWHAVYGIERGGAVLVRPDGYVAWRCVSAVTDPSVALRAALAAILGG